ncbi:MAG: hypothetical protein HVK44_03405, partial [Pelagibacteraceae bacterium]|nr:hypothetical protein [Pelagibacteraceae bacterium]
MAHIRKLRRKWQVQVRKQKIKVTKSFWKKSDASKWAIKTEAQIETGTYRRVQEVERIADIRICEVLNIYYEKHLKKKSKHAEDEKYLIDLVCKLLRNAYLTDLTGSELARFRDEQLELGKSPTTVKKYLALISRAINRVKSEHNIPIVVNPVQQIEKPQEP